MDTLPILSELLCESNEEKDTRKLQTALYLAQKLTGNRYYRFRVTHGRVFSDELDQDVSQLTSIGFLNIYSKGNGHLYFNGCKRLVAKSVLGEKENELKNILRDLFKEDSPVLEAAATFKYFEEKQFGSPDKLNWFREVPDITKQKSMKLVS